MDMNRDYYVLYDVLSDGYVGGDYVSLSTDNGMGDAYLYDMDELRGLHGTYLTMLSCKKSNMTMDNILGSISDVRARKLVSDVRARKLVRLLLSMDVGGVLLYVVPIMDVLEGDEELCCDHMGSFMYTPENLLWEIS